MTKSTYKILFVATLFIFLLTAITIFFLRPTPSDEEIPRGSRRVEIEQDKLLYC